MARIVGVSTSKRPGEETTRQPLRRPFWATFTRRRVPVDRSLVLVPVQDDVEPVLAQSLPHLPEIDDRLERLSFLACGDRQQLVVDDRHPQAVIAGGVGGQASLSK